MAPFVISALRLPGIPLGISTVIFIITPETMYFKHFHPRICQSKVFFEMQFQMPVFLSGVWPVPLRNERRNAAVL